MFTAYRKLADLLDRREKRLALLVFALLLGVACVEVVGVASVMPFMAVLANPQVIQENEILSSIYDAFGFQSQEAFLFALGCAVFLILVFSLTLKAIGFWAQLRFSQLRNHILGYRLVAGYLRQPYAWFLNHPSSDIAATILSEINQVVVQALFPAMQLAAHGFVIILLIALLVLVDPVLALSLATLLGGAYSLVFYRTRKYLVRLGVERREANQERFRIVQEAFGGVKDVKIAGLESNYLERFRKPSIRFAERVVAASLLSEIPTFAIQGLLFGGMMLILLSLMMTRGDFQQALPVLTLYAFAGYRLMPALQGAYKSIAQLRFSSSVVDALHRDLTLVGLDVTNQADEHPSSRSSSRIHLRQDIVLNSVAYTYPNAQRAALSEVSLRIAANTTVGFVGSTGSGKTTIADVMLGLLEASSGTIAVDGNVLSKTNMRHWQRNLGYVPQSIYLIDAAVAENIAFGIPANEIDYDAVKRAAKAANLDDFVVRELPQGYETRVGERGVRLSGGQKQRIGIARALYHDPEVLILDEATSALDNLTEKVVMEAVASLGRSKTIVLIAHRLSTVQKCDEIFLLDHGQLIACGSYDELIRTNETFRKMASAADG